MAFDQDPPVTRSLKAAKRAAEGIYDALVDAGVLLDGFDADAVYAEQNQAAGVDSEPLFGANGETTDPET